MKKKKRVLYYDTKEYKQKVINESKKGIYIIPILSNVSNRLSQRVPYKDWLKYWHNKL